MNEKMNGLTPSKWSLLIEKAFEIYEKKVSLHYEPIRQMEKGLGKLAPLDKAREKKRIKELYKEHERFKRILEDKVPLDLNIKPYLFKKILNGRIG